VFKALRKREEAEKLLEEHLAKEQGIDYERQRNLTYTAEEVERWEKRQKKKAKNANNGFVSYDDANLKKHLKLTERINPDLALYEETKQKMSAEGQLGTTEVGADTIDYINPVDHKPTEEDTNRLTNDLKKQYGIIFHFIN
jgi:pre-mRNA-splicing factor SYF2